MTKFMTSHLAGQILRNSDDYRNWLTVDYLHFDILDPVTELEHLELALKEYEPLSFPCVVFLIKNNIPGEIDQPFYLYREQIEECARFAAMIQITDSEN